MGTKSPPEIAKIAIQTRSAIGQSNVQTMHAGGLTRLQNPPARQFCRPRDLYPNVPHALCDDLHWIPRAVGQPHVPATGQRALDRSRGHRRIMRRADSLSSYDEVFIALGSVHHLAPRASLAPHVNRRRQLRFHVTSPPWHRVLRRQCSTGWATKYRPKTEARLCRPRLQVDSRLWSSHHSRGSSSCSHLSPRDP